MILFVKAVVKLPVAWRQGFTGKVSKCQRLVRYLGFMRVKIFFPDSNVIAFFYVPAVWIYLQNKQQFQKLIMLLLLLLLIEKSGTDPLWKSPDRGTVEDLRCDLAQVLSNHTNIFLIFHCSWHCARLYKYVYIRALCGCCNFLGYYGIRNISIGKNGHFSYFTADPSGRAV